MKLYFAYGSNLNTAQMKFRCPSAIPVGTAVLRNWRLVYKGSRTGAYLTIEPARGYQVPLGVWAIDRACETALDRYEGCPAFYSRAAVSLEISLPDGRVSNRKSGLIYVMNPNRKYALPSEHYVNTCRTGYEEFGFDQDILEQAYMTTRRKMK